MNERSFFCCIAKIMTRERETVSLTTHGITHTFAHARVFVHMIANEMSVENGRARVSKRQAMTMRRDEEKELIRCLNKARDDFN